MKTYNLRHCSSILQATYGWYKKKKSRLSPEQTESVKQQMLALEASISSKDRAEASKQTEQLEKFSEMHFKKSIFDYIKEIVIALTVAIVLAVIVRQVWFEPYEIPTGSMRPTFREQDHVTVTKTPFGINIPLTTGHFLFEPDLVQRTSAVTFTSEGVDRLDEDTTFMAIIPYKKRLIKRMIGKPGDSLYFYGGKIYGVDRQGQPIDELISSPWMQNLEHIPFIRFSGEVVPKGRSEGIITQNNQPVGKLTLSPKQELQAEIFDGKNWIKDDPQAQKKPHDTIKAYSDILGIGNFAMARLLTKQQLKAFDDINLRDIGEGVLYLELRHHPSLTYPKPLLLKDAFLHPVLIPLRTIIPLQQKQLDAIMDNMYTARLVFKNSRATRYSVEQPRFGSDSPIFENVPDGTYEFYHGKLSTVGWGGITSDADRNNPLYNHSPANVQKLFNLGIEMNTAFSPQGSQQYYYPSRYAYFRDGDLYLLNAQILKKDDPTLIEFNNKEAQHEAHSTSERPYIAFKDNGAPLKSGHYDIEKIRTFGLTVPDGQYYLLGDNHAMSADSRSFGFLPEANLQGAPSLIIWPPGERWGIPEQKPYPLFNLPRTIVWSIAALTLLIWWLVAKRRREKIMQEIRNLKGPLKE